MKKRHVTLSLVLGAALVASNALFFAACSSSDSGQPGPTPHEGGTTDTSTGGDGGGGGDTGGGNDSAAAYDGPCLDASPQQDPYNACSPYVGNCIPFTRTVPQHPQL
jgi:hypothetical protein